MFVLTVFTEYFEDAVKLISYITFYNPDISPNMWHIFPELCAAFQNWACEYMAGNAWWNLYNNCFQKTHHSTEILVPLDNYISKGTQVFLTGNNVELVYQMYHKVTQLFHNNLHKCVTFLNAWINDISFKLVADPRAPEQDSGDACKLIEVVILNCKGRIDQWIPRILELAIGRLAQAKSPGLKVLLLGVVRDFICWFFIWLIFNLNPRLLIACSTILPSQLIIWNLRGAPNKCSLCGLAWCSQNLEGYILVLFFKYKCVIWLLLPECMIKRLQSWHSLLYFCYHWTGSHKLCTLRCNKLWWLSWSYR